MIFYVWKAEIARFVGFPNEASRVSFV